MKHMKNDHRTCLSQIHLDNALRIALETRKLSDFPFDLRFNALFFFNCFTMALIFLIFFNEIVACGSHFFFIK